MSEAKAYQCDACSEFAGGVGATQSPPDGWLVLFGLIQGERRHDFCSPKCLYAWTPQLVSARTAIRGAS